MARRWQNHPHLWPLLLWSALWALFFSTLLLGLAHLAQSDLLTQFHTFGRFQAQEMLAGRFPLWSPGSYGGFPFAADTQAAVFYLPRWLTIFLSAPWDFPYYALELEGLLHIWLLGVFTYFLAHNITKNRWAGLVAAVAFGLGGFITSYPLLQLAILETITWLPLVLLMLRRTVRVERPLLWLIGAGLILGLSFLAGHPQTFLHVSYLVAFYFLFLAFRARWQWRWLLGLGALVAITAVGVATAAWLPALHYMQASTRSDVSYEFVAKGFALLDYFQLWVPGHFTRWVSMYVGLPALALVILTWLLRRTAATETKAEIGFWTAVALITLVLSLGDKGILFELVYHTVPGFSLFRQQERIVSLFSLSMALLAAMGLALWHSTDGAARKQAVRRLLWIMAFGILFTGFILAAVKKSDWVWLWVQQGVITTVTLILLWHHKKINWRGLALVLLLCFDLFLLSRQQLIYQAGPPNLYWPQPDWLNQLQQDDPGRIETQGFFDVNVGELHNLEDIRGISPLRPQALDKFEDLPAALRWQLMNVTHVFAGEAFAEGMTPFTSVDNSIFPNQPFETTIFHYDHALPRAHMVYQPLLADSDEAALQLLQQSEFDPVTQVVLTAPESDGTTVTPPTSPPTVITTRISAKELHIQAITDSPGILVISEWAYPGWQATVNGEPWSIETANYAQQALILPAGSHDITLRFSPWDVKVGTAVSLLTLIVMLILAWRWQPISQKTQPTPVEGDLASTPTQPELVEGGSLSQSRASTSSALLAHRKWLWLMLLVLLLAFGLRVFQLGAQELRGDEAFSYLFARLPAAEITPTLVAEGDPHSPLHYLLLHSWMALTGDSEFTMRFISLLPGLLLVPLLFQLGRLLGGRRLGVLAAFWLAISHLLVWLSQDVRNQYMLTLLFSTLATVIFVWKLYDGGQGTAEQNRDKRLLFWMGYIAAAALAVYSHYYGLFILAAHGLYLWWPQNGRFRRLGSWLLAGTVAGLLFLPWVVAIIPTLLAAGQLSDPSKPELAHYLTEVGVALTTGLAVTGWWPRWLFLASSLVVGLGSVTVLKKKPGWGVMLIGWLAGTTLFIFLIRFSRATFNSFYISVAAPAWWLLFSVGLAVLWQQRWRGWRVVAVLIAGLIVAVNAISLKNYYFDPVYSRSNGYRSVAAEIVANEQAGDVFLAHYPDPAWGYYLRHAGLPTTMQPATFNPPAEETEQALETMTETYDRFWFAPYVPSVWDADNVVGRWLDYHMLPESRSQHQKLQLWAVRPLRTADEITKPVDALLNEEIFLQAAYLTVNGRSANLNAPITITANDTLAATLIWSATATPPEDYAVFVHLLAEDGSMIAQHDGVPLFGTRPTTSWQPSEQLLDRHELVIGETGIVGNGRLLVGMYRPTTLERLPFANCETALELAPVIINP